MADKSCGSIETMNSRGGGLARSTREEDIPGDEREGWARAIKIGNTFNRIADGSAGPDGMLGRPEITDLSSGFRGN